MKVLVYQSHIDEPDARPFRHDLAKASKASFEQYAEKHGYDYKWDNKCWINPVTPVGQTRFFYSFQGLAPSNYDYVIYADSDVIAKDEAPPFPLKEGFSAVPQINGYKACINSEELTEKQKVWVNEHLSAYGIENHEYLNSGVWCADRTMKNKIWNTWRATRNSCLKPNGRGVLLDQPVLNACVAGEKINHLGYEWNAISDMLKPSSYQKAHFIHYGGLLGSIIWKTENFLGTPDSLRKRIGVLFFNHFCKDMVRYGKIPVKDALTEIINKQFNHD